MDPLQSPSGTQPQQPQQQQQQQQKPQQLLLHLSACPLAAAARNACSHLVDDNNKNTNTNKPSDCPTCQVFTHEEAARKGWLAPLCICEPHNPAPRLDTPAGRHRLCEAVRATGARELVALSWARGTLASLAEILDANLERILQARVAGSRAGRKAPPPPAITADDRWVLEDAVALLRRVVPVLDSPPGGFRLDCGDIRVEVAEHRRPGHPLPPTAANDDYRRGSREAYWAFREFSGRVERDLASIAAEQARQGDRRARAVAPEEDHRQQDHSGAHQCWDPTSVPEQPFEPPMRRLPLPLDEPGPAWGQQAGPLVVNGSTPFSNSTAAAPVAAAEITRDGRPRRGLPLQPRDTASLPFPPPQPQPQQQTDIWRTASPAAAAKQMEITRRLWRLQQAQNAQLEDQMVKRRKQRRQQEEEQDLRHVERFQQLQQQQAVRQGASPSLPPPRHPIYNPSGHFDHLQEEKGAGSPQQESAAAQVQKQVSSSSSPADTKSQSGLGADPGPSTRPSLPEKRVRCRRMPCATWDFARGSLSPRAGSPRQQQQPVIEVASAPEADDAMDTSCTHQAEDEGNGKGKGKELPVHPSTVAVEAQQGKEEREIITEQVLMTRPVDYPNHPDHPNAIHTWEGSLASSSSWSTSTLPRMGSESEWMSVDMEDDTD